MSIVLRLSACLLLTATLAACNKTESTAPTAVTDTPATPPAAPAPQATATPTAAPDDAHVVLDMGKVKSWMQAQKNLALATKDDPTMDPAQNVSEEDTAKYIARMEASPKMRAAIEAAGLSVRDYANITDTLLGAMMTQGAIDAGQLKKVPDGIDPASVEFVKQHNAELQALLKQGAASGT